MRTLILILAAIFSVTANAAELKLNGTYQCVIKKEVVVKFIFSGDKVTMTMFEGKEEKTIDATFVDSSENLPALYRNLGFSELTIMHEGKAKSLVIAFGRNGRLYMDEGKADSRKIEFYGEAVCDSIVVAQ